MLRANIARFERLLLDNDALRPESRRANLRLLDVERQALKRHRDGDGPDDPPPTKS